ncbi:MAG: beta-ketoacyl-ACP synthase [Deltaproteobacteria bacterium]|nr:MAG: beta-ketoacyl-ACP synthase [Deltaproteobacteria bacterium]
MGFLPVAARSAVSALGATQAAMHAALFEGKRHLSPPPFDVPERTVCGVVSGDVLAPLRGALAAFDCRQARLAVAAAESLQTAVRAAIRRHGADRVALVVGSSTGGVRATERALGEAGPDGPLPPWFDYDRMHAMGATVEVLRRLLGVRGPAMVVSTACSSSGKALATAKRLVDAGLADAAVAGGVDSLCVLTVRGFSALGVLDEAPCRPFAADRGGINLGEAAAFLVLDPKADAPWALLGCGESSDAHHMSAPDPEGHGAAAAMRAALEDAGLGPEAVGHVNAHGTATIQNDAAESAAICEVLGPDVPVLSTKGWTGHTLGAAGALEAVIALCCLDAGRVPASLGADPLDPSIPCAVTRGETVLERPVAISNSFAFGGSNVSVILGRVP